MNSGACHSTNGQTTCTDAAGNSCTTAGSFCDPTAAQAAKSAAPPTAPKPNAAPLNLKPKTQTASVAGDSSSQANQTTSVPACSSKPPYLPWGGRGSAMITVSGGQACGIGWHDTGATILDSMSVSSQPAHGSLRPQDQHVIIFTPAPGYKGQDSFTLSMREHNGGRSATLSVTVSLTID
jgi:Bacterial Ig domain